MSDARDADGTRPAGPRPPEDWRPPSLLRRRRLDGAAVAAGVAGVLAFGVVVVGLGALGWWLSFVVVPAERAAARDDDAAELAVVETKFVKLGRERDPRKLPNRRVPQRSTAPRQPERGVGRERAEPPPERDAGPPPPDPMDDLLTRLGTRAEALSKLANRAYDQEGDPEGVADGTETRETGSIYAGRLRNFFRRGFVAPTQISDAELRALRATVRIRITDDGRLGGWSLVRESGNPDYDEAVLRRMREADGAALPEVPPEEADDYLGQSADIRFVGRN